MTTKSAVVVGVDGSWPRAGALDWALHEAAVRRLPLRAVHVAEPWARDAARFRPVEIERETVTPVMLLEAAEQLLRDVAEHVAAVDPGLSLDLEVVAGPPAQILADLSSAAELLVVGRRGLGAFSRLLIGSTSDAVANHGRGPVVVVPQGWQPPKDLAAPVVVGVDGQECEAALEFAFEAAEVHGASVRMVHVWDVPAVYAWDTEGISGEYDQLAAMAERRLGEVAEQWYHKHPEVDVQQEVRRSHPVLGLIDAAVSADARLLVVGGHRQNRVTGFLLGSTARGVLHHAPCPVAVVHERRGAVS